MEAIGKRISEINRLIIPLMFRYPSSSSNKVRNIDERVCILLFYFLTAFYALRVVFSDGAHFSARISRVVCGDGDIQSFLSEP